MPANPARPDLVGRLRRQREEVRQVRLRSRGHTEARTFIVGNIPIVAGLDIPPLRVGIDFDGETPEWKRLHGFRSHLLTGTATVDWYLNSTLVGTEDLTDDPDGPPLVLDPPIDLADGDRIRPYPVDASEDALGLSADVVFITGTE